MRYVNLNRLFSTTNSLEHDSSITHIFLSTFVGNYQSFRLIRIASKSIVESIFDKHPDAEITFATHLDPGETDRNPTESAEGKHLIVYPPFSNPHGYGCFHMKLIVIRFHDRLRVVISSSNLWIDDWNHWSQCVWMQVGIHTDCYLGFLYSRRKRGNIWSEEDGFGISKSISISFESMLLS